MNVIGQIVLMALFFSTNLLAANTEQLQVISIESRDSGYHAIYLSGSMPNEGCVLNDRAIILESNEGGKAMLSLSLSALAASKKVIVGVEGCTVIAPEQPQYTAPKVVKIQIYN